MNHRPVLTMEREMLEATRNGMFGGPFDQWVRHVPGLAHYYADGVEVSPEEFARLAQAEMDAQETER